MATSVELAVQSREKTGSAEARRLRKRGLVPGNIYGHGEGSVTVSVPEESITPMVFAGHRVVDIRMNGGSELAIIRDVQWDTFGQKILHFDLLRVSRDEKVEMEVAIELRGISPGVLAGGILDLHLHSISIVCPAYSIPDHVYVKINNLGLGQAIHVRDLELPPEIEVQQEPDEIVVQVTQPAVVEEEEEAEAAPGATQPEVIGRKAEKEEEGD
jgi:large subunit ribosomal protein L25